MLGEIILRKSIKKLLGMALVSGCVLTGGILSNSYASGNISNSDFRYDFSGSSTEQTVARTKYDYTSSYMSITSFADGDPYYDAYVVKSDGTKFSQTWKVRFSEWTAKEQYIKNYALEDNNGNATSVRIKADGYRGAAASNWHVTGVWSPDSI